MRSFDERSHSYLGYVLRVEGTIVDEPGEFIIAIGKAAQAKHRFQVGMEVSGLAAPVSKPSATVPKTALFTRPDRHARCRGERACPTAKKTGSTRMPPPIGGRMIEGLCG